MSDHSVTIYRSGLNVTVKCESCNERLSSFHGASLTDITALVHEHIENTKPVPMCKCGHKRSEHNDNGTGACTIDGYGWYAWADHCMDYTPVPEPMCTCGHKRSEHSANGIGVCAAEGIEYFGTYADDCMDFTPV